MITAENSVAAIDPERPWPGLLSFAEEAADLFHGRSKEVQELVSLLNHETVSFLYGKSGLGKTSLLQAGLFPRLRDADRLPVYVRFSYDSDALPPREQLFNALIAAMDLSGTEGERPKATDSVWAFLHRRDFEWWSPRNKPVRPVFVFDQFEELFTVGQESTESRALGTLAVDLLMELTTQRPGAELRREFETQPDSVERYDYDAANYRVLFAFREDFLPQFDQLRERLRVNPHNRLPLERLNGLAAAESVLGTGGDLVTRPVAEDIVRFVAGERDLGNDAKPLELLEVEPWLLSLVCQQVNEQRLAAATPQPRISSALLTGTRDLILAQYYASCVAGFDARVPAFLEDRLLTESGFRNTYPYDEAIRIDGITARVIDTLVDRRLLRLEQHMGVQRVEISHDVLGPVLVQYRQQRMQQEADAIAALRDISNRRRISEGRQRSGRLVVVATTVLIVLGVAFFLRSLEATRAQQTARWAQDIQSSNYSLLLKAVRTRPVAEEVRTELDRILTLTAQFRRRNPLQVRWASQHLQFMFLATLAADSGEVPAKRRAALVLTDSLANMEISSEFDFTELELAYYLGGVIAGESGDSIRQKTFLRQQVDLLKGNHLPDFNRARAIGAARRLATLTSTPEEALAVLEPAIEHLNGAYIAATSFNDEPGNIGAIVINVAETVARRQRPDTALIDRLLLVGHKAHLQREIGAALVYQKDSSAANRDSLVSALGTLTWMSLLTRDFDLVKDLADQALKLNSALTWPVRYRIHARVFTDDWSALQPDLQTLDRIAGATAASRKEFYELELSDIAEFRKLGLRHSNLDRYEQFFRDRSR